MCEQERSNSFVVRSLNLLPSPKSRTQATLLVDGRHQVKLELQYIGIFINIFSIIVQMEVADLICEKGDLVFCRGVVLLVCLTAGTVLRC